ncbi:MAG: peptidoglycan-binding protein [Thiobacillaceae bacterium]|nr:peptidoglycan-binding protein [Thiobacillaceae bacterium]
MVCPVAVYWAEVLCDVNATPQKIGEIQQALAKAGYYKGPINGKTDAATTAAVSALQKAKGLVPSGFLDLEPLKALGVAAK